jgi:purine-binding chemotaxis protein CheW
MDARVQQLLKDRARELARPAASPVASDTIEVVSFALGTEVCAVESRYVVEVCRLADLALLPGAEPPVLGVTAWRGRMLTILDLRPVLGIPVEVLNEQGRVVVLGERREAIGVRADAVHGVVALRPCDVREPPVGVAVKREYLRGVTGDALLVLDAAKLLRIHA